MDLFFKLFGTPKEEIKLHCIICPSNDQSLFSSNKSCKQSRGLFFSVLNTSFASIISTRNNFLIGDCVLALKDTACKNIYLFGSCAGTGNMNIGDKVIVENSYSLDSFTQMTKNSNNFEVCSANKELLDKLISFGANENLMSVNCATVSSLLLEEKYLGYFAEQKISCIDMETSIVFSAAALTKKNAVSLLYVTDILSKKKFHEALSQKEKSSILNSRKSLSNLIINFIKNDIR
ncbi:MAG: hypothetical protein NT145_02125 [Elusimicrobia bacterium]|nr:hypothetical protein [Elusimicrobiota bacterium]